MTGGPNSAIARSTLRSIVAAHDSALTDDALRLIDGMGVEVLNVGRSQAGTFVNIMRIKSRSAAAAGVDVRWNEVESVLSELGDTPIRGVALPGGGSVVLDGSLDRVLGLVLIAGS